MGYAFLVEAQPTFVPSGQEYSIVGSKLGDQTSPSVALRSQGGYLVWEDNGTGGALRAILIRPLDANFAATYTNYLVNNKAAGGENGKPQVVLLKNGNAMVVWQNNRKKNWDIYARVFSTNRTFVTAEIQVNTYAADDQREPVAACLADGNVVILWRSFKQDGRLYGVYGQLLSPTGRKIGKEFRVNGATDCNQRSAAVAALPNGQFVVVWVAEGRRWNTATTTSVDIYGCIMGTNGVRLSAEFLVNSGTNLCANPSVGALANGGLLVAWSQKAKVVTNSAIVVAENSWDIFARGFSATAAPVGPASLVNTFVYGDQYFPRVSTLGNEALVLWTSQGQDGSREGVFGRLLNPVAAPDSDEFRVNTTTVASQIQPVATSDGQSRFLAVWSSFTGLNTSFDLFAQTYQLAGVPLRAPALAAASTPAASQPETVGMDIVQPSANSLQLAWPAIPGTRYQLQCSRDMKTWLAMGDARVAAGANDAVLVEKPAGQMFFRIIRLP